MKNHSKLSNMPFFPSCQHSVVNNIMFQVANTMWLMTNHSKLPILHAANKMWFMNKSFKVANIPAISFQTAKLILS